MKKKIILIGGGGHAESVIDAVNSMRNYEIVGILDNNKHTGTRVMGVKIIGNDSDLEYYFHKGIKNAVIAMGSIGKPEPRQRIYKICQKIGYGFPNIIDASSVLAANIIMGEGNFIGKGVIINSTVWLGNVCIINTGTIIEHDCRIEDFVHIAPGSVTCGNVWIKENTHVGAHSTIIQNVTVGKNTVIGAGSVVLKDLGPNQLVYGNPGKEVMVGG
jgi:sugar O-acyltransferase (sialic acid O-acetyltransferase NeuD family)